MLRLAGVVKTALYTATDISSQYRAKASSLLAIPRPFHSDLPLFESE